MKRQRITPSKPMSKQDRKNKIVQHLAPMKGRSVFNKSLQRQVKFTRKGIKEIGEKGKFSNLSMSAAMDAPNQAKKAVKVGVTPAKKNRKQQEMKLKKMIIMRGKHQGKATKVNVGMTANGEHKIYSVTLLKRKRPTHGPW